MSFPIPRVRRTVFTLAIICFLFPFVTIACPGGRVSFTGLQLATGHTMQVPQMFGPPQQRRIPAEPLAAAALVCAALGVLVSFARGRSAQVGSAWIGGAGIFLLLLLKTKLDGQIQREAMGLFDVKYEAGYWAAALMFAAGIAQSFLTKEPDSEGRVEGPLAQSVKTIPSLTEPPGVVSRERQESGSTSRAGHSPHLFCEMCGDRAEAGGQFCAHCGASLTGVT
jgi:hypothetical protein